MRSWMSFSSWKIVITLNEIEIRLMYYVLIDTGLYVYNKIHLVQQWNKNEAKLPVQQPFGGTIFHLSDNGGNGEHGWWNIISNAKCNRRIKSIRDYVTLYVCVQCAVHRLHAGRYWIRKEQFLIRNNLSKKKMSNVLNLDTDIRFMIR